jgi:hypothetical protein
MVFSFRCVCTWLVSILANIIFIGAIAWSSSSSSSSFKIWPLSLVVSVIYTVILWFSIYKVHTNKRRSHPDDVTADNNDTTNKVESSVDVTRGGELENNEPARKPAAVAAAKESIEKETKISCALSLLYLSAILSLGGPGTILVLNVLPCFHHYDLYDYRNDNHDCDAIMSRGSAIIGGIFLTALPITIASVHIWATRGIPSSAVTLFVGIGLIFLFVSAAMNPLEGGMPGLTLWLTVGFSYWIAVCICQLYFNPNIVLAFSKEPLLWGFYGGTFFAGMLILYRDSTW